MKFYSNRSFNYPDIYGKKIYIPALEDSLKRMINSNGLFLLLNDSMELNFNMSSNPISANEIFSDKNVGGIIKNYRILTDNTIEYEVEPVNDQFNILKCFRLNGFGKLGMTYRVLNISNSEENLITQLNILYMFLDKPEEITVDYIKDNNIVTCLDMI